MVNKVIDFCKKKQNLVLGLLVVVFLVLLFAQTISITGKHADATVKDFSIMRIVSVPTQGDVKTSTAIFKNEIGKDLFSFDHLYNNVYSLMVFGIIALVFCFAKYNKTILAKTICLLYGVYGLYSVVATNNMAYILSQYDGTYVLKIVVAALIILISVASIISMVIELSKNEWLKYVNVHAFLNCLSAFFMLATLAVMFVPFEFETRTASIMGFMLMPSNYSGGFLTAYKNLLGDVTFNSSIIIPVVVFVLGIMASIIGAGSHKNATAPVMATVWAVLVALGSFLNPLMALDSKFIVYVVLSVVVITLSVINMIQHYKANEIYRQ